MSVDIYTNPDPAPQQDQAADTPDPKADFFAQRRLSMIDRIKNLGGPSEAQINAWRAGAPGGRLRAFSLDDKRFFIIRAISGLELAEVWKTIPKNSTEPEKDAMVAAASRCTLWTNATVSKKLAELDLRTGPAGTPSSIWKLIEIISDYADPQDFEQCSVEL